MIVLSSNDGEAHNDQTPKHCSARQRRGRRHGRHGCALGHRRWRMLLGLHGFKIALQKSQFWTKGQIKLGPVDAKPLQLSVMAVNTRTVDANALGHTQLNESSLAHDPSFVPMPSALAARSTMFAFAMRNNKLEHLLVLGNDMRLLHETVSVGILA